MPDENIIYSSAEDAEKPIDFRYYIHLFKKNFYIILTFFIIVVTIAAIYASKIPDNYISETQLMIERPQAQRATNEMSESIEGESYADDYYNTQIEIIKSSSVLGPVVNELKLTDYFENENEELVQAKVRGMLQVGKVGTSRLLTIRATCRDPELAASIANAVARAYIRKNFENMLYYSKEVLSWLPMKDKGDGTISVQDPFGGVRQVNREELIDTLPSIQTDPTIRSLKEKKSFLEAELGSLLKQYREKHPLVVKARQSIKFLDESLDATKKNIVENLKTQAEGKFRSGHARIIEEAKIPKAPLPQNRMQLVIIAGIAELFISLLLIILIDYFDDTIRTVEDFERKGMVLPFLGPVPLLKGKLERNQKNLMAYYQKQSHLAEAFCFLRVAINFSGSPESLKTLVFTSCLPHEGKSFISHNIAVSYAMDGNKTLLVDCDLRRPVVHTAFQLPNTSGISNYLTSNIELESITKDSFVENLSVITSGPVSPNPGEILGSEKMKNFLEAARKRYDRVIIDCPPLTGIGDAYVVGNQVGQVVMVIAAGKTPVDLLRHTQKQLDKTATKILGVVLSMIDLDKERHSGYSKHYYHTYTRYYDRKDGDSDSGPSAPPEAKAK